MGQGSRRRRRRERRAAREQEQQRSQASPPGPGRGGRGGGIRATIDSFGGLMTIGAVVIGIVVVGILVYANRPGGDGEASSDDYQPIERSVAVDGRLLGDPDAPVRIVAYEDFQCPVCKRFTDTVEPDLMTEFVESGIASFEFHNMIVIDRPAGERGDSHRAAEASLCAADQGLFWEYHDILFLRQGAENANVFSTDNLKDFARQVDEALPDREFDLDAFDECLDSRAKEATVVAESQESTSLFTSLVGRVATPSFLINGEPLQGLQDIETFRGMIDRLTPSDNASSD